MTQSCMDALRAYIFTSFMPQFCHLKRRNRLKEGREVESSRRTRACCFVQKPVLDVSLLSGFFRATDSVLSAVYLPPGTDLWGAARVDASVPLEVRWP